MQKKKLIIDFNHISNRLSTEEIDELKAYYMTYHKKMWMYKSAYKRFKKWEFAGNISSIVFATGGIASSVATSGASLLAISSVSVIIQAYMKHKKLKSNFINANMLFKLTDIY